MTHPAAREWKEARKALHEVDRLWRRQIRARVSPEDMERAWQRLRDACEAAKRAEKAAQ